MPYAKHLKVYSRLRLSLWHRWRLFARTYINVFEFKSDSHEVMKRTHPSMNLNIDIFRQDFATLTKSVTSKFYKYGMVTTY
jgi:hypothetical protein